MPEETVGLRALMDMSRFRGNAKEYLDLLNQMIQKHKQLDAEVKRQAAALGVEPADVKRAAAAIKAQSYQIAALGRSLASAGRMSQQFGRNLTRTFTLPLIAAGAAAAKVTTSFEHKMAAIQSIGKQSDAQLEALGQQFLDMSKDISRSNADALQLADTFYYLQGSGFAGSEGLRVLQVAALGAQAGLVDIQQATEALIYSLNAYGASASEAQHFSDVLFRTVDIGVVNYDELSGAIGLVAGNAAGAGINFEELGAAMAVVSKQTKGASRAARELNMFISALVDPSKELDEAFQDATGHSAAWMLQNRPLADTLQVLYNITGGTSENVQKLIGTQRGARAAFALLNDGVAGFSETLEHYQDVTGATAEAAVTMSKTTESSYKHLKNVIVASVVEISDAYLPVLKDLADEFANVAEAIGGMSESEKKWLLVTAAAIGAGGPILSLGGSLTELAGNLIVINSQLEGGLLGAAAAAAPIAGVAAVLGLAAALAVKAAQDNKKLLATMKDLEQQALTSTTSYEDYRASMEKIARTLPEYSAQLVASHGANTKFRDGLILTKEEFEKLQDTLKHLGSVSTSFYNSLDEGNLSLKTLRDLAAESAESVGQLRDEAARYAEMWGLTAKPVDLTEWSKAWEEQSDSIRDIFLDLANILQENEDNLTQLTIEGTQKRNDIIAENNAKILALRQEQQEKVIALENAYLARRADLEAAHDEKGLEKLDEAYQKRRLKMEQAFSQEEMDQVAANKRALIEQERAQVEQLISLHESNAKKIDEQRKKLAMTVFLTGLEKAMEDGEIDAGEKKILLTLGHAFGLRLGSQIQYAENSLELTRALSSGEEQIVRDTATRISAIWEALAEEQRQRAEDLRNKLANMPRPESVTAGADYSSLFATIAGETGGGGGGPKRSPVRSLQETVQDVTKAINDAIEAFEKLAKYHTSARLKQALTDISNDIVLAVTILSNAIKTTEGLSKKDAKRAAQFAEYAGQVADSIGNAAESFSSIAGYVKASEKTMRTVASDMALATSLMYETWASGKGVAKRAAQFAEHINKIVTAFGSAAEAFNAAKYYTGISRATMVHLATDMDQTIRILEWHMKQMGPNLLPRAEEFAQSGGAVVKAIGDSVESFGALRTYSGVSRKHSVRFAEDMARVMKEYAWVFSKLGKNVGPLAVQFAKSADDIMGTVKNAVEALSAMRWYGGVSDTRVRRMVSDMAKIIWLLNRDLGKLGVKLLQDTAEFSENSKAALELIANGIDPLIKLQEYGGVAEESSERFAEDLAMTVENIGTAMANLTPDALLRAVDFSQSATSVTDMVSSAVDALVTLQNDYKGVDAEKIERLRNDLELLTQAMSGMGRVDDIMPGLTEFLDVISQIVSELNSLPDKIHIDFSASGNIPSFQNGGIVPGPPSQPTLAIVHGGERITPAAAPINNTTVVNKEYNWNLDVQYANAQSEAALRNDIEMLQLLSIAT